jgi:hypothetical protein
MPYSIYPITEPFPYVATNESKYDNVIKNNGHENVKFVALHHACRCLESEFIFSRAVARFQHLILM